MKKKLFTTISAILLSSLTLSTAGCSPSNLADIIPDYTGEHSITFTEMFTSDETASYKVTNVDATGLASVEKTNTLNQKITYQLFDLKTNNFIPDSTSTTPLYPFDDGLFYSSRKNSDGSTSFSLYTKQGGIDTITGTMDFENGYFTKSDNNYRAYITLNGRPIGEQDINKPILTNKMKYYATKTGDYYIYGYNVFDSNGNFIKTLNPDYIFNLKKDEEPHAWWTVGETLFIQTSYELPSDYAEYDVFISDSESTSKKLNINTYSYNVRKNKAEELDSFDYYVKNSATLNDASAFLEVCKIEDMRLGFPFLQSFGKDGKINVDIQKLAPGAVDATFGNGYCVFKTTSGHTYVYQGNKLIHEHDIKGLIYLNNISYQQVGSIAYIYDLNGNEIQRYSDVSNITRTADNNLCISCAKNILVFNTNTKNETMNVTVLNESVSDFSINAFFIQARNNNITSNDYRKLSIEYLLGEHNIISNIDTASIACRSYGNGCQFAVIATTKMTTSGKEQKTFTSIRITYPYSKQSFK